MIASKKEFRMKTTLPRIPSMASSWFHESFGLGFKNKKLSPKVSINAKYELAISPQHFQTNIPLHMNIRIINFRA